MTWLITTPAWPAATARVAAVAARLLAGPPLAVGGTTAAVACVGAALLQGRRALRRHRTPSG